VAKRLRVALALKWDREFESAFLQRRVRPNAEPAIDCPFVASALGTTRREK
jgi:hypothetical protein